MIKPNKSNVQIISKGARHSVFVDGVQMDGVFSVVINYEHGELPVATIKAKIPHAATKSEYKDND